MMFKPPTHSLWAAARAFVIFVALAPTRVATLRSDSNATVSAGVSFIQVGGPGRMQAFVQDAHLAGGAAENGCAEGSWPDKDGGLVCGSCKVLVDRFDSYYKTCSNYCGRLGRACVGAWEEAGDTCQVLFGMTCDQELASSDAICQCSQDRVASPVGRDRCNEDLWPDKDGNLVCGDCKVLVDKFDSYYKTCSNYCGQLGRACVGAWEEAGDTCNVLFDLACDQELASSDAICECSPGSQNPNSGSPTPATVMCGIAPTQGDCASEVAYLARLDPRAAGMSCMGFGGQSDPCSLSITNDRNFGMLKNPSACTSSVFFLWDEPSTQCNRGYRSCGAAWAPRQWKAYVDRWESELRVARARGMKVTSPLMISGDVEELLGRFADFFRRCPECSQQGNKYYIDVLAWNAFALQQPRSRFSPSRQYAYLGTLARALKNAYPGRPVYATNFGLLYARTAMEQADAITAHNIFNPDISNIDGVYYFSGRDFCGRSADECTAKNSLRDVVEGGALRGKTLGRVLVDTCFR